MTIIERIQAIVGVMTTGVTSPNTWTFYSMQSEDMNRNDDAPFPFIHLDRPLRVSGVQKFSYFINTYSLNLFFGGSLVAIDKPQEDREAVMALMNTAVMEFLSLVRDAGPMTIVDYSAFEGYNAFDMNADGMYLNLKIKINETFC